MNFKTKEIVKKGIIAPSPKRQLKKYLIATAKLKI
jgi:hypothetical protein